MAERELDRYLHLNMNGKELRNFAIEVLTAHPTGLDLFEGRVWQLNTDDHIYFYLNGNIRQVATAEDLNRFGALIGGHDATSGIPTQGSGVNEVGSPDLSIEAGDSWRIIVPGTISGLASGHEDLEIGDLLIALVDGASSAGDFMAIEMNLPDTVLDEVQNYTDITVFPVTGEIGVIYIDDATNLAYIWDGSTYTPVSLPNIQHEATLGAFPVTGDMQILYIADDTNLVYFWDGSAYIPVSGIFSNFYSTDGTLIGNRTVIGGSNNLTFTDILGFTLSVATYDLVTAGNMEEAIGGNKIVNVVGSSTESSAGKTITSTGAGNNVEIDTDDDGALVIPGSANPDGDVSAPVGGMQKYDETDEEFRFYQGGAWRTFGPEFNIVHFANQAGFPVAGDAELLYIADDTELVYFWNGATYVLISGVANNIYENDGAIPAATTRTATIADDSILTFEAPTFGTILSLDGATGKVTIPGLLDPVGLQVTPGASNPGDAQTLWSNSGDSNNPYWGPNPLAFASDTFYNADGNITGNRVVTGDESDWLFTSTNFKVETGDGAFLQVIFDEGGAYAPGGFTIDAPLNLANGAQDGTPIVNQQIVFSDLGATAFNGTLQNADLTAARTWELPDASGTLALASAIPDTIYTGDGTVGAGRTATLTDTLTFSGGTVIDTFTTGGRTITSGVGDNPLGFGLFGDGNLVNVTGDFDIYSYVGESGGEGFYINQLYDNTTLTENSQIFQGVADFSGTDRPYVYMGYTQNNVDFNGFEANVFGERIQSQASGLNRLSSLTAATGIAFLSGSGGTGYIGTSDQLGMQDWMNNGAIPGGWGGVYEGSGTTQSGATTITLPTGASLIVDGDFAGTLFQLDGDTGKVTMDGLVDPSGLQLTPQASNPGDANTIWSNSGDSNNPYYGAIPLLGGSSIYTSDGTLTGARTLDGNNLNLTFDNTNFFTANANQRVSIAAGDLLGTDFVGVLGLSNVGGFLKSVGLQGGQSSNSQYGSFNVGDTAGQINTSWSLSHNVSGRSQEFQMFQPTGMRYSNDVPGQLQAYGFEYDSFDSTTAGEKRSRLGHYDNETFLAGTPTEDSYGFWVWDRRQDSAIDNTDIIEYGVQANIDTETMYLFVNENAAGNVSRITMQPTDLKVAVEETGIPTNEIGFNLTNTTYTVFDAIGNKGMVYAADYSAAGVLDQRWIPDYGAVQSAISAATPNTLYSADDTLAGNRSVDIGGNTLTFSNGDFRLSGASVTNMLFVDDSTSRMSIGGGTSAAFLDITNQNANGVIMRAFNAGLSAYTLRLYDNANNPVHLFRNTGRVDLAENGAVVNIGGISGNSGLNVVDDIYIENALGNAVMEINTLAGGSSILLLDNQAANQQSFVQYANTGVVEWSMGYLDAGSTFRLGKGASVSTDSRMTFTDNANKLGYMLDNVLSFGNNGSGRAGSAVNLQWGASGWLNDFVVFSKDPTNPVSVVAATRAGLVNQMGLKRSPFNSDGFLMRFDGNANGLGELWSEGDVLVTTTGSSGADRYVELSPRVAGQGLRVKWDQSGGQTYTILDGLPSYLNDAAADADTDLESGAIYQVTGDRTLYVKP